MRLNTSRGLITFPSELARTDGALVVADNVIIDAENIIQPRRGFTEYGNAFTGDVNAKQLIQYKDRLLRHYSDKIDFDNGSGTFVPFAGSYYELENQLRIKYLESNGNLYFTTLNGVMKISAKSANDFNTSTNYIRLAGGVKAIDLTGSIETDESGFLPAQSKVAYRLVWGSKDANNNLILGSPSARFVVTNNSSDTSIGEQNQIEVLTGVAGFTASTYIYFNSKSARYLFWFDTTGTATAPSDANTIDAILIKVDISGLATAAAVAGKLANVISVNATDITVELDTTTITLKNIESGDVSDINQGNVALTALVVSKLFDGVVSEGIAANVNVESTIPSDLLNYGSPVALEYFYQLYRTAVVTTVEGLDLNDIDPGDEMNLVYESPLTITDLTNGYVAINDITPESFRANGTFLYTNASSGSGILQANERPPIAKDIAQFRNATFYANTKSVHTRQLTLISVADFVSGATKFVIGNSDIAKEYTFVGVKEKTQFTVQPTNLTVGNSYIEINAASNANKYYIWFDKGNITKTFIAGNVNTATDEITITNHGFATNDKITLSGGSLPTGLVAGVYYVIRVNDNTIQLSLTVSGPAQDITATGAGTITQTTQDPALANKIGIRVPLYIYANTLAGSKEAFIDSLLDSLDFTTTDSGASTVDIECTNNGEVTDPVHSAVPSAWTTTVLIQGDGEDVLTGDVLLSGSPSAAISIQETATSLVKVINRDITSPVTAIYLSGPNDLPGMLAFESRTIADNPFYIAISGTSVQDNFNPELPNTATIDSISVAGVFETLTTHGFVAGDEIYVSDSIGTTPFEFSGKYIVATTPTATSFTLQGVTSSVGYSSPLGGICYYSDIVSDNSEAPNRLYYSKIGQPEAVPSLNYLDIGAKDKAIERIVPLRDSLFIFKQDGIYIVSGFAAPFTNRLLDTSAIIIAPDSAATLNNQIYLLSTQGVVRVTESGVAVISRVIEDKIKEVANFNFNYRLTSFGLSYESDRAYFLWLPTKRTDTYATQCYRYNVFTSTWTRMTKSNTCGLVLSSDDRIYLGSAIRPYIEQERKNLERQDYSDRDFLLSIVDNSVTDTTITISNADEIEVGDVVVQEQYATISRFNILLRKIDNDLGPADNDYYANLKAVKGDNLANKFLDLVTKLNADVNLFGSFTPTSGSNNALTLRTDFNSIIDGLNNPASGTALKDYKEIELEDKVIYEALIEEINYQTEVLTTRFSSLFVVGDVRLYKSIRTEIQWSPLDFGQPEILKQIREGSFMFDQNNFSGGIVAYSSDRSEDFQEIPFRLEGPGYWASYNWANVVWGGGGRETPVRTYIPQNKQRCRFINVKFKHNNARETYKLVAISLESRALSTKGYR